MTSCMKKTRRSSFSPNIFGPRCHQHVRPSLRIFPVRCQRQTKTASASCPETLHSILRCHGPPCLLQPQTTISWSTASSDENDVTSTTSTTSDVRWTSLRGDLQLLVESNCFKCVSSRTDLYDDVVDVTSLSALDVVEINQIVSSARKKV